MAKRKWMYCNLVLQKLAGDSIIEKYVIIVLPSIKIFTSYFYLNDVKSIRVPPKLSLLISVGEDTDRGPAVVGVLTDHLLLRQFGMHPTHTCNITV